MELVLTMDNILNTSLKSPDRLVQYTIKTPHSIMGEETTTITKTSIQDKDGDSQIIGMIEWRMGMPGKIVSGQITHTDLTFFRGKQKSIWRQWTALDGVEYQWKIIPPVQMRTLSEPRRVLVHYKPGSFWRRQKPTIILEEDAIAILDSVIVGFVFAQGAVQQRGLVDA